MSVESRDAWLRSATTGLGAARVMLAADATLSAHSAFHAHLSPEHALKALLVALGVRPRRIRDLPEALRLVRA